MHSLYVDPDAQGHGVGSMLLRFAADRLLDAGCHRAHTSGCSPRTSLGAVLGRHGWTPDGATRVEEPFGENEVRLFRVLEGCSVTTASAILEIRNLTVVFGTTHGDRTAAGRLPVRPAGATVALVGESGSGKSTTAAAVSRLLPPNGRVTGGSIRLDGATCRPGRARDASIRGAGIGLVPQDPCRTSTR